MKSRFTLGLSAVTALAITAGCVDHRPVRNGLRDESVYLEKTALTGSNPKFASVEEAPLHSPDDWLFKLTVVEASSPNIVGQYAFPGLESDLHLVRFRFDEDRLKVLDARALQADDPDDPNDDRATVTERVMMSFMGTHVDVKLRESLDGERTNFREENTEEPWRERQQFKVDFENTTMDPITSIAWFYGDFLHDCAGPVETTFVPDSFDWNEDDQHMSFVVEVTYAANVGTLFGTWCYDMLSLNYDVGTATIRYRFSFYRPGPTDFETQVIAEKDPVNRKYGAFQRLNMFRDADTGILGAQSLLHRWNPNRPSDDPVIFYFHKGFPPKFKPMFETIAADTNQVFEQAGATLRIAFMDHDHDGVERHLGDLRYSFAVWHQDMDNALNGLAGYGPSVSDPRTGEIINANLHLYNYGIDIMRFYIQDFLEEKGAGNLAAYLESRGMEATEEMTWDQVSCEMGDRVSPTDGGTRLTSALFNEMRRVMDLSLESGYTGTDADFLPEYNDPDFLEHQHRLLGELRYVEPAYNDYVFRTALRSPLGNFAERSAIEADFQGEMHDIMMNENPFDGLALDTRAGIDAQLEFLQNFRTWKKNHHKLMADQEYLFSRNNVYRLDAGDAVQAMLNGARRCVQRDGGNTFESDVEFRDRVIENIVFNVAIHELGHNLSLRHNFYGSVDHKHHRDGEVSSSVMDYVRGMYEAGLPRAEDFDDGRTNWGLYDEAALTWIYGSEAKRTEVMADDLLYCTDEHRFRSPMCQAHDFGITPSQIVLNHIEVYDWLYDLRNRRAYRTFWDTSSYVNSVFSGLFSIHRMWYLALFDWGGGGVQETLKTLDQLDGGREVLTDSQYDAIAFDFNNDLSASMQLMTAFYDALINQPASFRNYQTEFDPYYGDILRLGIIIDKLFSTFAFMDLQQVYNYDPNVNTYLSMYDVSFDNVNFGLLQRVLDNMLGANYDTFPWFQYYALNIFAAVTNTNLFRDVALKDRIAIQRFESEGQFAEAYGEPALNQARDPDNPAQIFVYNGEEFIYTYLRERNWHLVASKARSPVSYQFVRDHNETLNASASDSQDNYGLKILLAYHEYFSNFSGF